jgi:hypothetical protein
LSCVFTLDRSREIEKRERATKKVVWKTPSASAGANSILDKLDKAKKVTKIALERVRGPPSEKRIARAKTSVNEPPKSSVVCVDK